MMPETAADTIEYVWNRPWPWSIWLTVSAALLLCVAVLALYWHERGQASRPWRGFMASLRIGAILLAAWMLAGWTIERYQSDKPDLVILLDDSASMQTRDGSARRPTDTQVMRWEAACGLLRRAWTVDGQRAEAQYRPKLLVIDEDVRMIASSWSEMEAAVAQLKPEGTHSRLGDCLIEALQRQSGRPTAALVLLTDGIVTSGVALEESLPIARRLNVPIVCIATGQQLPQPDLALMDLLVDDAVYLGDRINVQVTVSASDISAHRATVSLRDMQSGQVVDSAQAELAANRNASSVQLSFVPKSAGSTSIKLEVAAAPGEKNLENNSIERVIEVRDQTLRVLLVQREPSFEYRFLKTLLERTANQAEPEKSAFELDVVLQDADAAHVSQERRALRLVPGDKETIANYDVILLGQLDPSLIASSTQQLIVDQVTGQGCGLMFICHPDFDPAQLATWPLGKLLPIDVSALSIGGRKSNVWQFEGTTLQWHPTTLGKTALPLQLVEPANMDELWRSLPGPDWYYVARHLKEGAQVLASTSQGKPSEANASSPLLVSQFAGAGRVVMQTNDETYRWIGYRGSELMYERYWIQMLRWLSRGKLNRQAQTELVVEPRQSQVGQPVQFMVKLNSEATTAIGDNFCQVTLEQVGGESRTLELKRTQTAGAEYKASDANLPAGSYRASLTQPQDTSASSVTFTVTSPPGEQANLRSDWRALQALAEQSHGKFYASGAENWVRDLPKGTAVRRGSLPPLPLWNNPWIAILLIALLTSEWILRRTSNML